MSYIRDAMIVIILIAVGFTLWFVYRAGQNADLKADMKMLSKQLAANTAHEAQWAEEARLAEAQRQVDMQSVTAAIANQRTPVIVRFPTRGGAVPGAPAPPAGSATCPGPAGEGPGVDIRPKLNEFETRYEGYLATCRALLNEWPH